MRAFLCTNMKFTLEMSSSALPMAVVEIDLIAALTWVLIQTPHFLSLDHCAGAGEQNAMTMHQTSQVLSTKNGEDFHGVAPLWGSMRSKNYQMDAHFRGGPSSGSWLALVVCKMMVFATLSTHSPVLSGLASPSVLQIGLSVLRKHSCPPFCRVI